MDGKQGVLIDWVNEHIAKLAGLCQRVMNMRLSNKFASYILGTVSCTLFGELGVQWAPVLNDGKRQWGALCVFWPCSPFLLMVMNWDWGGDVTLNDCLRSFFDCSTRKRKEERPADSSQSRLQDSAIQVIAVQSKSTWKRHIIHPDNSPWTYTGPFCRRWNSHSSLNEMAREALRPQTWRMACSPNCLPQN